MYDLVVAGDSWTYGSEIINPNLDSNSVRDWDEVNDDYRNSNIYSHYLSNYLNANLKNLSFPAYSNDRILRVLINYITKFYLFPKKNTKDLKKVCLIGSGGNINKLFKMSGRTEGKPISYIYLNAQYQFLKQMSFNERVSELSLNPDRADVIIPATKIYLSAMKWSGARKIYVPKIGLSDGIIKSLFYNKL